MGATDLNVGLDRVAIPIVLRPIALAIEELDACFVVKDGDGQKLSYTPLSTC